MPVHQFMHDQVLLDQGLRNYWGYNTFGFLAPHAEYSSSPKPSGVVAEFKAMVRAFHEADIEVILDVVYNHTAEGNHLGPTIGFRGIDNAAYYRLVDDDKTHYMDYTGTGNSLNARHPHTLQLIMDSLRYWVTEMHVDGFRFDLASTLARELHDVDRLSAFFDLVQQDPIVSQVKLIAEPWDVGEGGYQVGNFPPGLWTEWNGKFRDTVRDYWRGEPATLGEFASRLTGSSDLYEATGRRPGASINFVTAHDGFTLADLVSYNDKHNEANGEDNRDGGIAQPVVELRGRRPPHRRSGDPGAAGAAAAQHHGDADVVAGHPPDARARRRTRPVSARKQQRLLPGQRAGVDGLVTGECGHGHARVHRQRDPVAPQTPVFRRRRFFEGRPPIRSGDQSRDIAWRTPPAGDEMTPEDWDSGFGRSLAVFLNGEGIPEPDQRGGSASSTTRSCCVSTPITSRSTSSRPASATIRSGRSHSTPTAPTACAN